jgi:glycosyltransferase involved in cell wall biosynthesis
MEVILSVYACGPNRGSEIGLGWNWVTNLSEYVQLHVLTECEFQVQIEKELETWDKKYKPVFYFIEIDGGESTRKMCWNQGDYRFYYYYRKWQKKAFALAKDIVKKNKIDIIHQLNMIGYREPGYLWKIQNIKYIWGPVGGFVFVNSSFLFSFRSVKVIFFYLLKNIANYLQAKYSYRVRMSVKRADILISASKDSYNAFLRFYNRKTIIINETGAHESKKDIYEYEIKEKLHILWVGRMIPTKMLIMTLEIMKSLIKEQNVILNIVGDGKELNFGKKFATNNYLNDYIKWHGLIPHSEVQKMMKDADVLFFPSIVEGTPHVVLEALSNGLPVICHDCAGQGEIIDKYCGFKIPLKDPTSSKKDFIKIFQDINSNKAQLLELKEGAYRKSNSMTWKKKAEKMLSIYNNLNGV